MKFPTAVLLIALIAATAVSVTAQNRAGELPAGAESVARIIGVDRLLHSGTASSADQNAQSSTDVQAFLRRQEITEAILAASLDVDSVLSEISNEHARLAELRSVLEGRRDRAVNLASVGNLVIGTGLGIVVNALQFKDSTALLGDGIGVGSGVAGTVLSVIGLRIQGGGPVHAVGRTPNMLAVLFGRPPVLHSEYPPTTLDYLNAIPAGEPNARGTRLEMLREEWSRTGRLGKPGTPGSEKKIDLLTASLETKRKLSIQDLTDRAYMLDDVAGRVSLMKRDLAALTRALRSHD